MNKIRKELDRVKAEYTFVDLANTLDNTIKYAKKYKEILTQAFKDENPEHLDRIENISHFEFPLFYNYEFGDTVEEFTARAEDDKISDFGIKYATVIVQYETNLKMIKIYEDAMSEKLYDMKQGI